MAKDKKAKNDRARKDGGKAGKLTESVPQVIAPQEDAAVLSTSHGDFDLEDPKLPKWVDKRALKSGGYPYDDNIDDDDYENDLTALQIELVKLQKHVTDSGGRVIVVFEGRDAAGKGGAIFAMRQYMNPRTARAVALPKPTDRERGQWYFQRYVEELPTSGELVLFDRSWYNRAGVEPVMGFCTAAEAEDFLAQTPEFEKMLVNSGMVLFKFWLDIGREMQLKRFHERRHNPLKIWKLSPIDYAALGKWSEYTRARDTNLRATSTKRAPWTVVLANDKRRARLNIIRHVHGALDYPGKDKKAVGGTDPLILGGSGLLAE
jgi:polyphosphate kinase 2